MTSPIYPSSGMPHLTSTAVNISESLVDLVSRVRSGDAGGMTDLYNYMFLGLRPYLARQLPPQDFRDKVHTIFVDVVIAIRLGQLRDPDRLLGFARTIARRKVSSYIDSAAADRRTHVEIGSLFALASPRATPEEEMVSREHKDLVRLTLARLAGREREILSRFYLLEQTEMQICSQMNLTHTQFRLLKWRSKAHFEQLSRKQLAGGSLQTRCANRAH